MAVLRHIDWRSTSESEYAGDGDALAEYYMGANDEVVSSKMFGVHNHKEVLAV